MESTAPDEATNPPSPERPEGGPDTENQPPAPPAESDPNQDVDDEGTSSVGPDPDEGGTGDDKGEDEGGDEGKDQAPAGDV